MATAACEIRRESVWRFSGRDALLVTLAAMHAAALAAWPAAPLIAAGVWWNSNTIAHNFIHRPFFRAPALNRLFSAALSVLLGIPQTLWRDRHLAHHAGVPWRRRISRPLLAETALVAGLWATLAASHPRFFLYAYAPGYLAGLALCGLQGYFEHPMGPPISHYGPVYNFLCFNDGYHAEHHADPSVHWTMLAARTEPAAEASRWPPLLRWLDVAPLEALERLVLRSARLQRFVLARHRRAFRKLLPSLAPVEHVGIVGGGLFPRTALILRELLPAARITVIDANAANLETARGLLGADIEFRHQRYAREDFPDCDLTVVPLCLQGDRAAFYRQPPSRAVLIHDWLWRRGAPGATISVLLLKRLNLVLQGGVRQ
jgi:hypothetical protein